MKVGGRILTVLATLLVGTGVSGWLITHPAKAPTRPNVGPPITVETIVADAEDHVVAVDAMGIVEAEKLVIVQPEVTGKIIEQSPDLLPGRRFRAARRGYLFA